MVSMPSLPFEVSFVELTDNLDDYVSRVFEALEIDHLADSLTIPRGQGFTPFDVFVQGYAEIHEVTEGFQKLDPDPLFKAIRRVPMALVVLRTILGLSPPEWASVTTVATGEQIDQGFARSLERAIRRDPGKRIGHTPLQEARIGALVRAACRMLSQPAPTGREREIHRLDKVDTAHGIESLSRVAREGVDYASLLYERLLGRPFASHRDSVSELVGAPLEDRIQDQLATKQIPFHRTGRAESLEGWDQNPDFFCPDPEVPAAVIEAKMTNDDGTARDKVARVLRLAEMRNSREFEYKPGFEVIACIGGRGFGVRKGDMRSLLIATRGKVFTLSQIDRIVECTALRHCTPE